MFILYTWALAGILSGVLLAKLDKIPVHMKDFVAFAILGYTLVLTVIWGEIVDRVIKKNPQIIDFRK